MIRGRAVLAFGGGVVLVAGLVLASPAAAAPVYCHGFRATIVGSPRADVLVGTGGDDVISRAGADVVSGRGGDDVVCAGLGDDSVRQNLHGQLTAWGGAGDDTLHSGGLATLHGGRGNDALSTTGRGALVGESGDDHLVAGDGDSSIDGGAGDDFIKAGDRKVNVRDLQGVSPSSGSATVPQRTDRRTTAITSVSREPGPTSAPGLDLMRLR